MTKRKEKTQVQCPAHDHYHTFAELVSVLNCSRTTLWRLNKAKPVPRCLSGRIKCEAAKDWYEDKVKHPDKP